MHKKTQKTIGNKTNNNTISPLLNLSNQEFLVRTLRLLGVNESDFFKQTKLSLQSEIFPKNVVNPTSSKQFFFIIIICLKYLISQQELSNIKMWYPPHNLNEQLQFKKIVFKILQNLQIQGKIPKNLILTKGVLMGDTSSGSLIQFLRFLSQLALRQLYIDKYSKRDNLIQVGIMNINYNEQSVKQNDINRFYTFPFVPTKTSSQPPKVNILNIQRIYSKHIENYKRKIIHLRTSQNQDLLDPQQIMSRLIEQKQLAQTLAAKVPKEIISENRAFDRRRIIDKNYEIWKQLNAIKCHFRQTDQIPIIRVEGQVDRILGKWEAKIGVTKIYQANNLKNEFSQLKKQAGIKIQKLQELKRKIEDKLHEFLNVQSEENIIKSVITGKVAK